MHGTKLGMNLGIFFQNYIVFFSLCAPEQRCSLIDPKLEAGVILIPLPGVSSRTHLPGPPEDGGMAERRGQP